jgi:hypothetical protein
MRLLTVELHKNPELVRLTGVVENQPEEQVQAYFEFRSGEDASAHTAADAFAAAMLIPGMRSGGDLDIVPPISPELCFRLPRIRDIFHTWYPAFSRIAIHAMPRASGEEKRKPCAATFFSGGVDSFYSLLKHRHGHGTLPVPLTHVIFMRGVETKLHLSKDVDASEQWVRDVSAAAGVACIFGETNIRTCLQGDKSYIHWERHYHGSALAAIASALSFRVGYVCIPSAFSYNHLVAHGSTPLLDEMYSTERMQVIHDGSEVSRAMKVAKMIEWDRDLVLAHLRVCIHNRGGAFNCGKCYKCVRTAIPLRVLGLWQQARTFPDKSTHHWEQTVAHDHLVLTEENLEFAIQRGGDAELVAMLQRVVRRKHRRAGLRTFVLNSPLHVLRPVAARVRRTVGGDGS